MSVPAIYNGKRENTISTLHIEQGQKVISVVLNILQLASFCCRNACKAETRLHARQQKESSAGSGGRIHVPSQL